MVTDVGNETALRDWRCEACGARYVARRAPCGCALCGGIVDAGPAMDVRPLAPALRVLHDWSAFARAVREFSDANEGLPPSVAAGPVPPATLAPLYVPFRRLRGTYQARPSPDRYSIRGTYREDICVADGFDESEIAALEAAVADRPAEEFSGDAPQGPVLVDEVRETDVARRADRRLRGRLGPGIGGLTREVSGEQYFLVPVWALACHLPDGPVRLLMEGTSGRVICRPMAATPHGPVVVPVEVIGHWAWLPALFCVLLTTLVDSPLLQALLAGVALATLLGGYLTTTGLRRARAQPATARGSLASRDIAADSGGARRRLMLLQRATSWLPGLYASIAVGAHLCVTAYVATRTGDMRDLQFKAASLAPRAPTGSKLHAAPLAPRPPPLSGVAGTVERAARTGAAHGVQLPDMTIDAARSLARYTPSRAAWSRSEGFPYRAAGAQRVVLGGRGTATRDPEVPSGVAEPLRLPIEEDATRQTDAVAPIGP
jgi:hypothetical protein